jgi:hypothetical protein
MVLRLWETFHMFRVKINLIYFIKNIATEFLNYMPGTREHAAGWRETGHYLRCMNIILYRNFILIVSHYFENSTPTIIRRQFRFSNRSWQPYWHSVSAWEKGLVIKHVLMSL